MHPLSLTKGSGTSTPGPQPRICEAAIAHQLLEERTALIPVSWAAGGGGGVDSCILNAIDAMIYCFSNRITLTF